VLYYLGINAREDQKEGQMSEIIPKTDRDRELYQLAERIARQDISRRDVLRYASALALSAPAVAALLAACESAGTPAPDTPAPGTSAPATSTPPDAISGTISCIANTGAGAESEAWNARIDAFERLFPNVKVQRLENVGETFYALLPKVTTMIAGGNAPDTLRVGNYSGAMFAARDALLPLDDFIENDPDVNWDDFYPAAQEAFKLDGKIWALPENGESYGLYYNATAFEEKGLPDPRELWDAGMWTKDAFLDAAKALTEGSGANRRFGFLYETWHSENWIFFNGGKVLLDDLKTVTIDQPAAYEGLQFAADLVNVYNVAPNPSQIAGRPPTELFQNGVCRMYMLGGWYIANFAEQIKDFQVKTVGPPLLRVKTSKLEISGYAITKASKNPQAAWELIKFITSPEGQNIWSVVGMPTRKSSLDTFLATGKYADLYKPFVELLPSVQHTPFFAKSAEIAQILTEGQDPIFLGQTTAEAACKVMAEKMRAVLAS
jgi:multiple sugar transport system substrate-binding protein